MQLTSETYRSALSQLADRHPALQNILTAWGEPPFWTHAAGFPGLVISVLAQQVSLESAQAAYAKLEQAASPVAPRTFLSLDDALLKAIGFSRQKTAYVRGIARRILDGELDLDTLHDMPDEEARSALMRLKGIGPWTAETYLLFALRRPDSWPTGDLALLKAIQEISGLAALPSFEEADAIASQWKPWRAVAARMLWHHYLCSRGRFASA